MIDLGLHGFDLRHRRGSIRADLNTGAAGTEFGELRTDRLDLGERLTLVQVDADCFPGQFL